MNKRPSGWEKASWIAGVIAAIFAVVAYVKPDLFTSKNAPGSARGNVEIASNAQLLNSPVVQGSTNSPVIQGSNIVFNQNIAERPGVTSVKPIDERERLLVGTWKGTMRQSTSTKGELVANGYTRLTESGGYVYSGEIAVRAPNEGKPIEAIFNAQAAGTWKLHAQRYEIVLTDIKSQPKLLRIHGEPDIDLAKLSQYPLGFRIPKLEDSMPIGSRLDYEIIELDQTTLRVRGEDIRKAAISYEAKRQ